MKFTSLSLRLHLEVFSSFNWNFEGTKFVYVAEKKKSEVSIKDFSKYLENENFGEKLQNVKEPVICVLDISKLKARVLDFKFVESTSEKSLPNQIFPAQPIFGNENEIYFTGIAVGSRKLGMSYIYCRHSVIYCINNFETEEENKILSTSTTY